MEKRCDGEIQGAVLRGLLLCLLLTGCEAVDQYGHVIYGRWLACELTRTSGDPEGAIALVDSYARSREELQHPGRCGDGCQRDLESFHKGAVQGAAC